MGFFPVDDKTVDYLQEHRPHAEADRRCRGLLQGAGTVRYAAARADPTTPSDLELDLAQRGALPGRPEAAAGPHRARRHASATSTHLFSQPVATTASARIRPSWPALPERRGRRSNWGTARADRRHHQLHQHLQPRRAAGRRPAGEEGRGSGPDGRAAHQDPPGAGLARGHRVSDAAGTAAVSGSWASMSPPTAAPPASAMPAT